jgi:2-oxoacid:acceptor oxidoreductase gamma subunit (pyruvate/2-ketoisovalerate family)
LTIIREGITVKEIRMHGRGGQGVVMASEILAAALVAEGKYATAFPSFGTERRGAPVRAFLRIDDKPIREVTQIYNPDCLLIADPYFQNVAEVFDGLKAEGILVMNSQTPVEKSPNPNVKLLGVIDATKIALEEIKRNSTNTTLVGAFAATTKWVQLESLEKALAKFFPPKILDGNIRCARRGYNEVKLLKY